MTVRDIRARLRETYQVEVSPGPEIRMTCPASAKPSASSTLTLASQLAAARLLPSHLTREHPAEDPTPS
jgi:hypothetical protein